MLVLLGGNGFIGRHVTTLAHARGIPVTVVTPVPDFDFLSHHAPSAETMSLAQFDGSGGDRLLAQASALVHLAGRSFPAMQIETPVHEIRGTVEPAFTVFFSEIAKLRPELPILFLSSGGTVYGATVCERIKETEPLNPISPYALGKVLTERCLMYCGETAGQCYAILRASNPVGRWHRNQNQGLPAAILRALRAGAPLEIFGDGTAIRDYLDADELADAILTVACSRRPLKDVWNIGSGIGHSVLEVVSTVGNVTGRQPEIRFKPKRNIDVPRSVLDPTRFEEEFGWRAHASLEEMIWKLSRPDHSLNPGQMS